MNLSYNVKELTLEQKRELLYRAKEKCCDWWVDILDCKVSFSRQRIDMEFDEIVKKLDKDTHFCVIHRRLMDGDEYLEVVFRTMTITPDYFLWIQVKPEHIPDLTCGLKTY